MTPSAPSAGERRPRLCARSSAATQPLRERTQTSAGRRRIPTSEVACTSSPSPWASTRCVSRSRYTWHSGLRRIRRLSPEEVHTDGRLGGVLERIEGRVDGADEVEMDDGAPRHSLVLPRLAGVRHLERLHGELITQGGDLEGLFTSTTTTTTTGAVMAGRACPRRRRRQRRQQRAPPPMQP